MLFAPGYDDDALEVLSAEAEHADPAERRAPAARAGEPEIKQVTGGLLVQDRDSGVDERGDDGGRHQARSPTDQEWSDMLFAWRIAKHVKSNAIVLAKDLATIGIGAGQMSRVDSVRLAVEKAQAGPLQGASLASDAFFPFADGPELAIEAGVTAIIQPGGSVRDDEVVAAADEAGVAMVFTGRRHFRH